MSEEAGEEAYKSGEDGSSQSYMEYIVLIKTEEARFITIV